MELTVLLLGLLFWMVAGAEWTSCYVPVCSLLFIAGLVESIGLFGLPSGNTWLFNLYLPLDFACTTWMIESARGPNAWKKGILVLVAIATAAIVEMRLRDHPDALITTTFLMGCLILVALLIYALLRLSNDIEVRLLRSGAFWLLFGHLIYFGGMIPYNSLVDYLYNADPKLARSLSEINLALATLRYASMSMALLVYIRIRPTALTA